MEQPLAALLDTFDEATRRAWEKARHTYDAACFCCCCSEIRNTAIRRYWLTPPREQQALREAVKDMMANDDE